MRIILNIKQIILWFISYMMIVSIAFIFGGILYLRSSNIIEQEITSTNISMLKQIQDSVELKLEEIKQISFQLKRDKDSQDFSYYMGKLNNTQIYRISNQIQKLSVYVTANKAMKQLSIYYPRINAVINAQSKYDPSLFYSNELELFWDNVETWEKEIRSMPASTMIKGETQCKSEGFLTELLLIEALTSHGNSVNKIMIRLDPDVILDILSSAYRDSEAAVYIMDGSGQILFSNTIEQFDERVDAIRSGESTVVLSDEKSYIVSGISSSENDWKYFMLTPKEIYMGQLGKMNSFALKLAVFVGFACILMAILLAYFQYRPVRRILNLIESLDGEHTQFSVFPYIQNALQKAQRDNAQIRERLSMQAVYNGKVNLSNYMTQTYSDIPILDVLEQYDMVMDKKYFTVVSFFFRGECTVIPTYDVKMELPLTVEKFIHTHMNHVKAYFFNTPQSLCGCINYDDAETDLKKIISQLYHELSDGGEIGLLAAISGTAETVYDLPNAYTQTLYINQNTAPSETGVFLYSQLDMQKYQFKSLSTDFCDSVTNSLLIADRENLFRLLDQAFADSQNWPAYLIKPLKIQIQSAFLTAVTTVNERLKINLADFSNQLTELNLQENTNDFIKRIKSIIDNVCQFLPAQTVLISSGIETRAKEIVHTHYTDTELNVYKIALLLDVNAAYLSRAFKERTNEFLSTYISHYRIEVAKELLQKNNNVTDVAGMCGFTTTNTFIRTFKKFCGVTPGKFKDISRQK